MLLEFSFRSHATKNNERKNSLRQAGSLFHPPLTKKSRLRSGRRFTCEEFDFTADYIYTDPVIKLIND